MHEMLIKALRDEANEAPAISSVGYSLMRKAADVIEEMEAAGRDFRDCRNELCLRCGAYIERHNGACDGCRWRANNG